MNGNFAAVINGDQRYNLFVTGIGNLLACIACCWTRRMRDVCVSWMDYYIDGGYGMGQVKDCRNMPKGLREKEM